MNDYGDSTMTFSNALRLRSVRRQKLFHLCALGVALMVANGTLMAATPSGAVPKPAATTAPATAPASLSVSKIDFKRGDDGAGRLILQFDGQGASPDLRSQGNSVVIDVGNARLPESLQKSINVTDFATPVQRIDPKPYGGGTQLVLNTNTAFESLAYQSGNEYVVEISPRQAAPAAGAITATSVSQAACTRARSARRMAGPRPASPPGRASSNSPSIRNTYKPAASPSWGPRLWVKTIAVICTPRTNR